VNPAIVSTNEQPQSSVEISSRVKGPPAVTVKVYHEDPEMAMEEALRLYADVVDQVAHYGASVPE